MGQTLFASVTALQGAVAYAWFVGTAGSETLQAITTINSAKLWGGADRWPAGGLRGHRRQFGQSELCL